MDLKLAPKPGDATEPHIRLLACFTCKTIDEIPDWDGPAEYDTLLQLTLDKHDTHHEGRLFKVPLKYMIVPKIKEAIVQQIMQNVTKGLDVFGTDFYDTRMTFAEDAMKCYGLHLRPKGQCPDFRTERKRLVPKTAAERKDAGLSAPSLTGPKVYLCDFCPVRMYNEHRRNEEQGITK